MLDVCMYLLAYLSNIARLNVFRCKLPRCCVIQILLTIEMS